MIDERAFEDRVHRAAQRCGAVAVRPHTHRLFLLVLFETEVALQVIPHPDAGEEELERMEVHVCVIASTRWNVRYSRQYVQEPYRDDAQQRLSRAMEEVHAAALEGSSRGPDRPDVLSALLALQRTHPGRLSFTRDKSGRFTVQAGPVARVTIMNNGIVCPPTLTCGHEGRRLVHLIRRGTSQTS